MQAAQVCRRRGQAPVCPSAHARGLTAQQARALTRSCIAGCSMPGTGSWWQGSIALACGARCDAVYAARRGTQGYHALAVHRIAHPPRLATSQPVRRSAGHRCLPCTHTNNDCPSCFLTSHAATLIESHRDDEYEAGYVYGPDASNQDLTSRSLLPLIKKFVEGYNVCVMCFGPTGKRKTVWPNGNFVRNVSMGFCFMLGM
jgi:hypothetical protein